VNAHRLVDVDDYKVVISGLGPGEPSLIKFGGLAHEAEHGGNVGLLFRGRDVAPVDRSVIRMTILGQ